MLPLRSISHAWGILHSYELPKWARAPLYRFYSYLFDCRLDEMALDLQDYENLGQFFYRSLKPNARPIDDNGDLICPSDGKLIHYGHIRTNQDKIEQIKNVDYSLKALLGKDTPVDASKNDQKQLFYCVIYLAPGDYHRFHSPAQWKLHESRHFAGEMFSVSPSLLSKLPNLFVLNERVVLMGEWKHGFFSMIPVAATNVGNIHLNFQPTLITNRTDQQPETHQLGVYHSTTFMKTAFEKGTEMGGFKLGSTVVLVFEAPADFEFKVEKGSRVWMGQRLG
jgi:phosphatidylserine decarboxylase